MIKRTFYLDMEKTDPLYCSYDYELSYVNLIYQGEKLAVLYKPDLQEGKDFDLGENKKMHVGVKRSIFNKKLIVLINDQPVYGSENDPYQLVNSAFKILCIIGGFSLLLGIISLVRDGVTVNNVNGISIFVSGAIFGLLAYFVKYRHSFIACLVAVILFSLDSIYTISQMFTGEVKFNFFSIIIKVAIIAGLIKALRPIKQIKESEKTDAYPDILDSKML